MFCVVVKMKKNQWRKKKVTTGNAFGASFDDRAQLDSLIWGNPAV